MSIYNVCFHGEIRKNLPELSSNTILLNESAVSVCASVRLLSGLAV